MDYRVQTCKTCGEPGRIPRTVQCVVCKKTIHTFATPGEPASTMWVMIHDPDGVHRAHCSLKCVEDRNTLAELDAQFNEHGGPDEAKP